MHGIFRQSCLKRRTPVVFINDRYYFPEDAWEQAPDHPEPKEIWQVELSVHRFQVMPVQLCCRVEGTARILWSDAWRKGTGEWCVAYVLRPGEHYYGRVHVFDKDKIAPLAMHYTGPLFSLDAARTVCREVK